MTKTEILEMAKEAGLTDKDLGDWMIDYGNAEDAIEKFADLVAEKAAANERNLCIHDCRELAGHLRCFRDKKGGSIADACAAAIEERGQKGRTHD